MTHQADTTHLRADRLDRPQHMLHRAPPELTVPDVHHPELLGAEVQRTLPGRVVTVEEERADIGPHRRAGGLVDSVRDAVARLDPGAAGGGLPVVIIAVHAEWLVVRAVAVDHDAPSPGHPGQQPREVQSVAVAQLRRPLEHEDQGVHRLDIPREAERRARIRRAVHQHLMAEVPGHARVVMDVLRAPGVPVTVIDEHEPHGVTLSSPRSRSALGTAARASGARPDGPVLPRRSSRSAPTGAPCLESCARDARPAA